MRNETERARNRVYDSECVKSKLYSGRVYFISGRTKSNTKSFDKRFDALNEQFNGLSDDSSRD